MKKIIFMTLAVVALFSCKEDEVIDNTDDSESLVVLNINVQGRNGTRAVEPGHEVGTGTINPTVRTVTFMAYDGYDNLLTSILLDDDQMKAALYGAYNKVDGTPGETQKPVEGATIGVPKGTTKVDVVLNAYSNDDNVTNINFFNYKDGKNGSNVAYPTGMEYSYDRVPLVSKTGKVSLATSSIKPNAGSKVLTYVVDFEVLPSFARFEVHGAIDVKTPEKWEDFWGNHWFTMTLGDFRAFVDGELANVKIGPIDSDGVINLHKPNDMTNPTGPYDYGYCGAIAGTLTNGFADTDDITDDKTIVYLPEYFYIHGNTHVTPTVGSAGTPKIDPLTNVVLLNAADANAAGKWLKNPYVEGKNITWLTWNPNAYYAVDVEEIFINNIKVRSSSDPVFLMAWPGSESSSYWPNWYKAYHLNGWHTAGVSSGHTFLCMGNMWDRIAINATGDAGSIDVPGIDLTGGSSGHTDKMPVITKKAAAFAGKSEYYSTDRNLGVAKNKAAGYQIFPQSTNITDIDANKDQLGSVLPHIIVKVKAYKTAADYQTNSDSYVKDKQFVTLKLFKSGSTNHVTSFAIGNIYRLDLSTLLSSMVGTTPIPGGTHQPDPTDPTKPIQPKDPFDPDPEMPGANVEVTINVIPWTIQNITPDI
ncbi:hypothetical protein [uncultured Parabacteroides sp.]|uniref:hypothetical protein n=1 Tax=uncultured Parabacteroides sp. TaxID=512312 RepID=UPI0025DA1720|nr:hypothetical protein [uncultured Parabacteroides sp.]